MFIHPEVIFIHNPKVAGRSIRQALCYTYGGDITTSSRKIKYDDENKTSVHSFACRVKEHPRVKPIWYDAYRFGFVRNPYDRVADMFQFFMTEQTLDGRLYMEIGMSKADADNMHRRGFTFWVSYSIATGWSPWIGLGIDGEAGVLDYPQAGWFVDHDTGKELVHDVFKMEEMDKAQATISDRLGKPITIPHINLTDKASAPAVDWTPAARKSVYTLFRDDFELYGYKK